MAKEYPEIEAIRRLPGWTWTAWELNNLRRCLNHDPLRGNIVGPAKAKLGAWGQEHADDVWQQFLAYRLDELALDYDPGGNLIGLVIKDFYYLCLREIRSERRRGEVPLEQEVGTEEGDVLVEVVPAATEPGPSPLDWTVAWQLMELLNRRLNLLPKRQREVIELLYFSSPLEPSYEDVAILLGTTPNNVKQRHFQALWALKRDRLLVGETVLGRLLELLVSLPPAPPDGHQAPPLLDAYLATRNRRRYHADWGRVTHHLRACPQCTGELLRVLPEPTLAANSLVQWEVRDGYSSADACHHGRLVAALRELPQLQQTIIMMVHVADRGPHAIGEILQLPPAAIQVHLYSAYHTLRGVMHTGEQS